MADKKLKRKYQQAPKEKKYMMIALPFTFLMVIIAILAAVGLGFVWVIIGCVVCLIGALIPMVFAKKEHKKWVEEGNKEYRYYDPDTGLEVDENGNPLSEEPAPIQEPKQEEPNLPEPDENGDIKEPAPVQESKSQPQAAQKSQQQAKYQSPFVDMMQTLMAPVGFGLLALVFLLRTIISIRELVYYGQNGGIQYYHLLHIVRLFGTLVLFIITVVSLINRYTKKQTANQYFSSFLKITIWFAVIGFCGFAFHATYITTSTITCIKYGFDFFDVMLDVIIEAFIFVAFGIAIIVFAKMALANKIDCKTRKIFAAIPFGIMIIYSILFMIMTGVNSIKAPGYYVTSVIMILACGVIGCIPFFAKFEDKPLDEAAASKAAAAAVAPAAAPVYQEPASEPKPQPQQPQPQKKNNDNGDPEVKSNKKGLLIILIVVAALVLCGGGGVGVYFLIKNAQNNQNREDGPNDDSSNPSSKSSSKSSSNSSSKSSSSSAKSYTASAVIAEIDRLNTGSATHYYLEDDIYYLLISYGAEYASESNLRGAVVSLSMPSYLTARSDPYSGTWGDGAKGYFQYLDTPKKDVTVYIGSYIYSTDEGDDLIAQVAVYNN